MGEGAARRWRKLASHRNWLEGQADALFRFYEAASLDPAGGFFTLGVDGRPLAEVTDRPLHQTARMAHCAAIGVLRGRPGAYELLDHAMASIWEKHRDPSHGGYLWSFDANGPRERDKLAYGHAFVLLAASSAKVAGHPDADRLLADIASVLETRFWEPQHGASAEEFREDWTSFSGYRGQNANMHLTEALMAAFEATSDNSFLSKAESVADLILRRRAAAAGWRVPEHYASDWTVDFAYRGSDMFRPFGYTPGHALEWSRLALQLWALGGRRLDWLREAAKELFAQATAQGWDVRTGGFYYTLEYSAEPRVRDRLWWPVCEAIGAAHFLGSLDGDAGYEHWYRRFWEFAATRLIDRAHGGWFCQLDDALKPHPGYFAGKPDLYHALQACLIPLYGTKGSLTREICLGDDQSPSNSAVER